MPVKKKKKASPKKKTKKAVKKQIKRKPAKKAVRKVVKKASKKKAKKSVKKVTKKAIVKENIIGAVTHYFPHVNAAVIKLKAPLSVGDIIRIKGHTTNFTQNITSMQIDRVPITEAKKGQEIGLLVNSRVRQHDVVIKE